MATLTWFPGTAELNSRAMVMQDDGHDLDGEKRLQYVHALSQTGIHLPSPARHYCSWHLFETHFQSLLFPTQSTITTESFESAVLSAKVHLRHPNAEKSVLDTLFAKGPKSVSTFKRSSQREDDSGKHKIMPLLGSLLEASIRSGNTNLAARLMNYDVDASRGKSTVDSKGRAKKGKMYYDEHFWRLALVYRDLETLKALLEVTDRKLPPKKLLKILLEAVCTSQAEALQLILHHQLPLLENASEHAYLQERKLQVEVIDLCLEEAVLHGHFEALISYNPGNELGATFTTEPRGVKILLLNQPSKLRPDAETRNWYA
ncbi:hypothetical protein ColTof4_04413 [Colletotrichum tofieldiae]|nr:hypothetical protein ColTof3_11377 [Colletotrichum tofieldiae]GKT71990.1 hypothetical protein ColTof4_04413 [Colletotrichum tofieldiae]GKT90230.1 hypothetical protein Ct61P_08080 [Colletotrichum tofieldiae]